MSLDTLNDLLVDNLRDLLGAERQLVAALPKMAEGARTPGLSDAFRTHLEQTRVHVERLESALGLLNGSTSAKRCRGMEGLLEEGKEVLDEDGDDAVKDAALIAAAQKVEHYEIAGYGCAITYAKMLGRIDIADLLEDTMAEETATDRKLTSLAEEDVNCRAAALDGETDTAMAMESERPAGKSATRKAATKKGRSTGR